MDGDNAMATNIISLYGSAKAIVGSRDTLWV